MPEPKNILITGGSGFIGRNLLEGFGHYRVSAPITAELDVLDDGAVESYLKQGRFDAVVHCAAVGISRKDNRPEAVPANLRMLVNLARCHHLYGKMIFLGSGAEYDKRRDLVRIKEQEFGAHVPADSYGFTKYLSSLLVEPIPNIINLRVFAVFGPGEDYETRFISNCICRSLLGLPIVVNQDVKFDYFYISDLVKIIDYFVGCACKHRFYNVGSGRSITLMEIAAKVELLAGKKLDVLVKQPGFNKEYTCDNSLLMQELGNFQFTPFDQALDNLYNWYIARKGQIDRSKLLFDR